MATNTINWGSIYIKSWWGFSDENGFGSSYYNYGEAYDLILAENGDNIVSENNENLITE
jgi:hypothetical protein